MPDLLFEMGVEEIPASYVRPALREMKRRTEEALSERGLSFREVVTTATPRRLVLSVRELPVAQAAREEEVQGPPEQVAYKDGEPTRALLGFAKKQGVAVEELFVKETPRGRYVTARVRAGGQATAEILLEVLPKVVLGLRWPKSMRWPQTKGAGVGEGEEKKKAKSKGKAQSKGKAKGKKEATFARPVRRLLCMLGQKVVPVEMFGLTAGRLTAGHPYIVGEREIALERADYPAYRALLKGHGVVVDRNERRGLIQQGLEEAYAQRGATLSHHDLLEEVTDLVEHPLVLEGRFDERYLALPARVIDQAMTEHQRYFPVYNADGAIQPVFLFVADRPERSGALVTAGNERVLAARLEDGLFYLREDRLLPLAERDRRLEEVTLHQKLGTLLAHRQRLERLAAALAPLVGLSTEDAAALARAAQLAKSDLTTDLVAEFPKLQGFIGQEYAREQGESEPVCRAIGEHYQPRSARDAVPQSAVGTALALADKLVHLACFYAAGCQPTGSADPFALRRDAIGIVRIISERGLRLSVAEAIALAAREAPEGLTPPAELEAALVRFLADRFQALLKDEGHRYDLVGAVLAAGPLEDFQAVRQRLAAVETLSAEPGFDGLYELVERTFNISKPLSDPESGLTPGPVDPARLEAPEEQAVWAAWKALSPTFEEQVAQARYVEAARAYRDQLAQPVHAFFDKVYVNVDDQALRENRLRLCRTIHDGFARGIADLTKVVLAGPAAGS